MALTTTTRKGSMFGPTIAVKGTAIKILVLEHSISYSVNQREATRVHASTLASSDSVPVFVASNQVIARVSARGVAVGEESEILAKIAVNTAIAVTISIGRFVLSGSLLLSDAEFRVGRKRRFVGVSLAGTFTGTKQHLPR